MMIVFFLLLFFGWSYWLKMLSRIAGGSTRQTIPDREKQQTPVCPANHNTEFPAFNESDRTNIENWASWDDEYYTQINVTKYVKWDTFDGDYCSDQELTFEISQNYSIEHSLFYFGVSGDLDGHGWNGVSKAPMLLGDDDSVGQQMVGEYLEFRNLRESGSWEYVGVCGSQGWIKWSGDNVSPVYNDRTIDGFCQQDCDEPYYETCSGWEGHTFYGWEIDNTTARVKIKLGDGVNVRSCESGLQVAVWAMLQVRCEDSDLSLDECGPGSPYVLNPDQTIYADTTDCEYDNGKTDIPTITATIATFVSMEFLVLCSCIACCVGAIGSCCTKKPDDDSSSDFRSAKKSSGFCC